MNIFRPRFVLLALFAAALPLLSASACGGSAFTSADPEGASGAGTGAGGTSSAAGSAGGGTGAGGGIKTCSGPEECDDGDVCTADQCKANGVCASSPKCPGTEQCCADGSCAQCCSAQDCDDELECTDNLCFMGQCMYVPNDGACEPNEYCASGQGCRPRKACGILPEEDTTTSCADDDECTTDSCGADNFCRHDYCAREANVLCCEGVGCAECCIDAQCDKDTDPCTVGSCEGGKCSVRPLCDGGQCCPSPDGKSATCGECCSANDCDDGKPCTDDTCGQGQCSHTPKTCPQTGYFCDPDRGDCIKAPECQKASDCKPPSPCQTAQCVGGVCDIKGVDCAVGTKCCTSGATTGACAACCDDKECSDNVECTVDECGPNGCTHTPNDALCSSGQLCDAKLGCVECTSAKQCDDGVPCTKDTCEAAKCMHVNSCSGNKPLCGADGCVACLENSDCYGGVIGSPQAAVVAGCETRRCVSGECKTSYPQCQIGFCCPPYGCSTKLCLE